MGIRWIIALLVPALTFSLVTPALAAEDGGRLGAVTGFEAGEGTYTVESGPAKVRLVFLRDDVFRLWLAPKGWFTDPANTPPSDPEKPDENIVVKTDYPTPETRWRETSDAYEISTDDLTVTVAKNPATFTVTRADGSVVWREREPLHWTDDATTQTLDGSAGERYVGAGMQNGSFDHTGKSVEVSVDYNWNEGGHPNSVPYYETTAGYGVFRNTFAPGSYDFSAPVTATHQEHRFDAYYFVAPSRNDLKTPLDGYTELTGRPFMPPLYGHELGDSDCYLHNANRGERHTLDSVKVADGYVKAGMPNGWMLVNDGYGCGYEDLAETGEQLRERNMQLGLWTEDGLPNQDAEVKAGVRVRKLDVAWVGDGYRFALDGCQTAYDGIQENSDARGFVWQPESWAGAQRCSVQWSGDQSGAYEYSRWQVPTYAGATMSGLAYTSGDVDGIFRGGPATYTRDLQWKAFLPAVMTMDGWAPKDKQPWRYGEPYTSINRTYLLLKERLLPYSYTYSAVASRTGVGQVRPLPMEYPTDPRAWAAKQEFLSGEDFLVAPVTADARERDDIYLPEGRWTDYWSGRTYEGPVTLDDYDAPLGTLPVFVRGGAIVPMWPKGTTSWATRDRDRLTLDVYPSGSSSFDLYEDDGTTRAFADGEHATQRFTVDAPETGSGTVRVGIGRSSGDYSGKPAARSYDLTVHTGKRPTSVSVGGKPTHDWSYTDGVVKVSTPSVTAGTTVTLSGASAVGGPYPRGTHGYVRPVGEQVATPGESVNVPVRFTDSTGAGARLVDLRLSVPDGWTARRHGRTFAVSVPDGAEPGAYDVDAIATYVVHGVRHTVHGSGRIHLPYETLAATYNNVGVTDDSAPEKGNFDGYGRSYSAQALADEGVRPGEEVRRNGATFTWPDVEPGTPDNVEPAGQTVPVKGGGSALSVLGAGATSDLGAVVLHYADGTSERAPLGFASWALSDPKFGSKTAVHTPYVNTDEGKDDTRPGMLFTGEAPLAGGKELTAVTLPTANAVHVFALAVR